MGAPPASVEGYDQARGWGWCGCNILSFGVSRGSALALGSGAAGFAPGLQPPSVTAEPAVLVRETGKLNKQHITVQPVSNRTAKQTQRSKEWSAMSATLHKWMTKKSGGEAIPLQRLLCEWLVGGWEWVMCPLCRALRPRPLPTMGRESGWVWGHVPRCP